jgi:zinc protease
MTEDDVDLIDADDAYDFYKDRFADASDFTFFFVGNIETKEFEPFLTKYLATLPNLGRKEKAKDLGERYPKGKIAKEIKKGEEPKSTIYLAFTGDFKYNQENRLKMSAMREIFNIKLRESIREDKGGVYGIGARAIPNKYPIESYMVLVNFTCDPDRVEELVTEVERIAKTLVDKKPEESFVGKAKELLLRAYETNKKENSFWLSNLYKYDYNKEDPNKLLNYPDLVSKVTAEDIHSAAKKYLNMKNYVQVILNPAK